MLPQQDCGDINIIHTVLIPCKFLLSYVGKLLKNEMACRLQRMLSSGVFLHVS